MSTIVKKAHADFEIRATVLYTGLSGLSRTEAHRLFTDLPCGWQLQVNIPQLEDIADDDVANSDSEDTKVDKNPYAGVYVRWPSYVSASPDTYPELLAVIVLRSLDSHRELKAASILIPSGTIMNPGIGYGRPQFMPWQELWGEESVCRKEGGFEIEVSIIPKPSPEMTNSSSTPPKESPPPLPVLSHPTLLTNLCRQIEGKPAVDVQFILFSRRHIQETLVGAKDPRPLFASFDLIRGQSKCLDTLIDDAGASLADGIQPQWVSHDISVDEYDYASDSDLDEDESVDVEVPEVNMDDISKYDSSSDDTTYDEARNNARVATPAPKYEANLQTPTDPLPNPSRVVPVKDVAYKTWKAMVYYLYTSKITFAPLSSRKTNEVANEKKTDVPCVVTSPKSMYRLAKKLELNGLCDLAKAEIKSQISEDNIVEEVFSKFTSRHVEIREMELEFLFKHWDTMKSSAALRSMLLKQLPHTAVLVADIVTH